MEPTPGEDQLPGAGQTDLARQARQARPRQRDADRDLRDGDRHVVGRHAQVAGGRQQRGAPDDVAVKPGHGDLRQALQVLQKALPPAANPSWPEGAGRHGYLLYEVDAGREGPPGAGHHHDADVVALGHLVDRPLQAPPHAVVEGVQLRWAIQGDPAERALAVGLEPHALVGVAHRAQARAAAGPVTAPARRRPGQPYISDPGVVSSSPVSSHVLRPERIIGQPP